MKKQELYNVDVKVEEQNIPEQWRSMWNHGIKPGRHYDEIG